MTVQLPDLITRLAETAGIVGDAEASGLVRAVQQHHTAPKLQILVVGSTGSGRASVVNTLLGDNLLPRTVIPKAPVGIRVSHGADVMVEVEANGARAAIPPARLRAALGPGSEAQSIEVRAPGSLLTTCDLRIEALEGPRPAEAWQQILAGADFTLLVLDATALLSERERRFVQDFSGSSVARGPAEMAGRYGLQRVAIVLNKMDLVPEDERDSILDLLHAFLGPFDSQPALFAVSATETAGDGELRTLFTELVEEHAVLRSGALRAALAQALDALERAALRERALASLDAEEVEDLRRDFEVRRSQLSERIERMQRRVATFVDRLIKGALTNEIAEFGEVFRRRLPDEVMAVEDVAAVRRYLPGYIETVWRDFLRSQSLATERRLLEELERIGEMIERDLGELAGGHPQLEAAIAGFRPAPETLRTFIMPRRGKHAASTIAKSLSFQGLFLLIWAPELGLLSLGAGYLVRRIYKKGISKSEREAVVSAATSATYEFERELQERIAKEFATLSEQLQAEVGTIYRDGIAAVERFLADHETRTDQSAARRDALETVVRRTIPELRSMLDQLEPESVA